MWSKRNIVMEGPEGQIATIRPFMIRSGITLWGRDLLSQWGNSAVNPIVIWGFLVGAKIRWLLFQLKF